MDIISIYVCNFTIYESFYKCTLHVRLRQSKLELGLRVRVRLLRLYSVPHLPLPTRIKHYLNLQSALQSL
jgi:hypothetical protein